MTTSVSQFNRMAMNEEAFDLLPPHKKSQLIAEMRANPLLTAQEVAKIVKFSLATVHRWIDNGAIPEDVIVRTPGRHIRLKSNWVADLTAGKAEFVKRESRVAQNG